MVSASCGVLQELCDGICMIGGPQRPNLSDDSSPPSCLYIGSFSICVTESGLLSVDESPGGRVLSDAFVVRVFS